MHACTHNSCIIVQCIIYLFVRHYFPHRKVSALNTSLLELRVTGGSSESVCTAFKGLTVSIGLKSKCQGGLSRRFEVTLACFSMPGEGVEDIKCYIWPPNLCAVYLTRDIFESNKNWSIIHLEIILREITLCQKEILFYLNILSWILPLLHQELNDIWSLYKLCTLFNWRRQYCRLNLLWLNEKALHLSFGLSMLLWSFSSAFWSCLIFSRVNLLYHKIVSVAFILDQVDWVYKRNKLLIRRFITIMLVATSRLRWLNNFFF